MGSHEGAGAAWMRRAWPGQQREALMVHFGPFSGGPGTLSGEVRLQRVR